MQVSGNRPTKTYEKEVRPLTIMTIMREGPEGETQRLIGVIQIIA